MSLRGIFSRGLKKSGGTEPETGDAQTLEAPRPLYTLLDGVVTSVIRNRTIACCPPITSISYAIVDYDTTMATFAQYLYLGSAFAVLDT